jgi:hypothetical protein
VRTSPLASTDDADLARVGGVIGIELDAASLRA